MRAFTKHKMKLFVHRVARINLIRNDTYILSEKRIKRFMSNPQAQANRNDVGNDM